MTNLEQHLEWMRHYYAVNGTPTYQEILAQIEMHIDKEKEQLSKIVNSERPKIENYVPKGTDVKTIHDAYLKDIDLYKYINALDKYIDQLEEQSTQWIDVNDRLPEENEEVIATIFNDGDIDFSTSIIGSYVFGKGRFETSENGRIDNNITHWMPLPEPPKKRRL